MKPKKKTIDNVTTELKFGEEKVIEFDLPKGYSARDAYWKGVYMMPLHERVGLPIEDFEFIDAQEMKDHFKIRDWFYSSSESRANFYLLLAYANGFKD